MKITIEIPDHLYGEELDGEGNITVPSPPIGKREKKERLEKISGKHVTFTNGSS